MNCHKSWVSRFKNPLLRQQEIGSKSSSDANNFVHSISNARNDPQRIEGWIDKITELKDWVGQKFAILGGDDANF